VVVRIGPRLLPPVALPPVRATRLLRRARDTGR